MPRAGRDDNYNKPGEDLDTYKHVQRGDLVLNKMKTWQGSLGVSLNEGIVSPAYFVAEPVAPVEFRFIHHLLRSQPMIAEYAARSKGIRPSQWDLPWEEFSRISIALPTEREQRAIADFLDAETDRIDALIAKKRQLARLLNLRFESWLRSILWSLDSPVLPLKRRWKVIDCKHRTPEYIAEGYPVMSPGDATAGRADLSRCTRFVSEVDFLDLTEDGRRPKRGDIIYSRNASIGIACYLDTDAPVCMGQDVCLITSSDQDQLFLSYCLNSIGIEQLEEQKMGSTFSRINVAQIVELRVPCPSPNEQARLALEFDHARSRVDGLQSRLGRQIELLTEHRQALITAAVTGRVEVPGVAAGLGGVETAAFEFRGDL